MIMKFFWIFDLLYIPTHENYKESELKMKSKLQS